MTGGNVLRHVTVDGVQYPVDPPVHCRKGDRLAVILSDDRKRVSVIVTPAVDREES